MSAPYCTSGKWQVEFPPEGLAPQYQCWALITARNNSPLGWNRVAGVGNGRVSDREAIANAHLIAAAPDMYQVLLNLLVRVEDFIDHSVEGGVVYHPSALSAMRVWLKDGRRALDKAEGRS